MNKPDMQAIQAQMDDEILAFAKSAESIFAMKKWGWGDGIPDKTKLVDTATTLSQNVLEQIKSWDHFDIDNFASSSSGRIFIIAYRLAYTDEVEFKVLLDVHDWCDD